ncbi:hypothetical protein J2TS4_19310 [Paenibacillus sp. J2TS4]|nr:hypothetical protein J2TS4_19310 [Paenibacillus sp. J2TS4]
MHASGWINKKRMRRKYGKIKEKESLMSPASKENPGFLVLSAYDLDK